MRAWQRILAAVAACGLLALLVQSLVAIEPTLRMIPLTIIAIASLAVFLRPGNHWLLFVLVPAGPILDFFFLTSGREIYATEVVLLSALSIWLATLALGRERPQTMKPSMAAMLLAAFGLVGAMALIAGHGDNFGSFEAWRTLRVLLLALGAVLLLEKVVRNSNRDISAVWTVATLGALLAISVGGLVEFLVWSAGAGEVGSFYGSSIGLAVHLAFFAPLALSVWLGPSTSRWRWLGAAAWITTLVCLPLTASRGAMGSVLGTSFLVVIVTALRTKGRAWRGMAAVLLVFAAGLALLAAKPELAGEAFAYKYRASISGDFFSTRVDAWAEALQGIKHRPMTGQGPLTWSPSIPLELARRHGIPAALLALSSLIVGIWIAGRRAWRLDKTGEVGSSGLHSACLFWGLALGLVGLFLVGLAETGLGARLTPLLAVALVLTGYQRTKV